MFQVIRVVVSPLLKTKKKSVKMQNLKRVAGWFHRMITFAFGSKRMYKNMQHAFSQDCRWKEKNLYLEYLSSRNKRLLIIYTCSCCRLPGRFLISHGGFLSTRPYRNFYPCWSDKPISKEEPTTGFFNNNPFIELFRFLSCNGLMHLQGIKLKKSENGWEQTAKYEL